MARNDDTDDGAAIDPLGASFGKRVAGLRAAKGWQHPELGQRAGMSAAYVWRVETGRTLPGLKNIARLAAALDVSLATLLEGVETPAEPAGNRPYRPTKTPGRPRTK